MTAAPMIQAYTAPGPASWAARQAPNSQPEPMMDPKPVNMSAIAPISRRMALSLDIREILPLDWRTGLSPRRVRRITAYDVWCVFGLVEIRAEGRAVGFGERAHRMPVVIVIDAHAQGRAALHALHHGRGQLEAQEMHGRGLVGILALEILVGDGEYAVHLAHPDPATILNADQILERHAPQFRIGKLEQQRCLPIASAGNQRVISVKLVLYARTLEDALGAEHLQHLIADGGPVLEAPGHVRSDLDVAQPLVGNDLVAQT